MALFYPTVLLRRCGVNLRQPAVYCSWNMNAARSAIIILLLLAEGMRAQPATLPTDLPLVMLEASGTLGNQQRAPCKFRLVPPGSDASTGSIEARGAARYRGATSLIYPKKSLAVTLDQATPLLEMPARRQWILNAAYIDRSMMRHKLSYDLFRSISTPDKPRYAADSRFVELHLNGRYHGIYLLMERVDRQLLSLEKFLPGDKAHACLYKAISHDAGFVRNDHAGYEQQQPEPAELTYWEPVHSLNRLIVSAPPEEFAARIGEHLDIDSAIDFHLLVLVTGNADGITKNYYLARRKPAADGNATFFFVPWDYDGTFGRNWNATPLPHDMWLSNHLFNRLLNLPEYRRRFVERWNQLRGRQFSAANIQAMIDANAAAIRPAMERNTARWPTDNPHYPDRITFEQDVQQMKQWVERRVIWLDAFMRQWQTG